MNFTSASTRKSKTSAKPTKLLEPLPASKKMSSSKVNISQVSLSSVSLHRTNLSKKNSEKGPELTKPYESKRPPRFSKPLLDSSFSKSTTNDELASVSDSLMTSSSSRGKSDISITSRYRMLSPEILNIIVFDPFLKNLINTQSNFYINYLILTFFSAVKTHLRI